MWMVECRYLGGWGDAGWTVTGLDDVERPQRFRTKKEAEAEINELIWDTKAAAKCGDMDESHKRNEYRAVKEKPNGKKTHR